MVALAGAIPNNDVGHVRACRNYNLRLRFAGERDCIIRHAVFHVVNIDRPISRGVDELI